MKYYVAQLFNLFIECHSIRISVGWLASIEIEQIIVHTKIEITTPCSSNIRHESQQAIRDNQNCKSGNQYEKH